MERKCGWWTRHGSVSCRFGQGSMNGAWDDEMAVIFGKMDIHCEKIAKMPVNSSDLPRKWCLSDKNILSWLSPEPIPLRHCLTSETEHNGRERIVTERNGTSTERNTAKVIPKYSHHTVNGSQIHAPWRIVRGTRIAPTPLFRLHQQTIQKASQNEKERQKKTATKWWKIHRTAPMCGNKPCSAECVCFVLYTFGSASAVCMRSYSETRSRAQPHYYFDFTFEANHYNLVIQSADSQEVNNIVSGNVGRFPQQSIWSTNVRYAIW